ncbi:MAG: hypothetical protein JWO08_4562 [Verrucomicrobiaceae bacterium]|nr:hypothetical protein [Verrucomicrobiaceae bacterium]
MAAQDSARSSSLRLLLAWVGVSSWTRLESDAYTRCQTAHRIAGMSDDDATKRLAQDSSKIRSSEDDELPTYTEKFGVTEDEIKKASEAVVNGGKNVEEHLANKK